MGIIMKNAPVETYHSISLVEHYYGSLYWVYSIIITEIPSIKPNLVLQIFLNAINNLASPNRQVPTLLVFSAYPKMT